MGSSFSTVAFMLATSLFAQADPTVEFTTAESKPAENLRGFDFVSRVYVPYGPDLYSENPPQDPSDQPYRGFGYGMGATEEIAYDYVNHYLYAASIHRYVTVIDYLDPTRPVLTNMSLDLTELDSEIDSIAVCAETGKLLLNMKDLRRLDIYRAVQRPTGDANDQDPVPPTFLQSIDVGGRPRMVLPNKGCDMVAIANQNKGKDTEQGSITIVRNLDTDDPTTTQIRLDENDEWDDNFFIRKGLHMPLTRNALQYWDERSSIAEDEDFSNVIQNYSPSIFLEPKRLAWGGPDEQELLVNLQENNGLLRINVTENRVVGVVSYGLKDHSVIPVDINDKDGECNLKTYSDLFALREPDGISTIKYNDRTYVIIANEGDAKSFGEEFEDEYRAKKLFKGNEFALPGIQVDPDIFDPSNFTWGSAALFNDDCEGDQCVSNIKLHVGSTAIDFETDPENPLFHRMVMIGGRGWSIFELPEDPDSLLKLIFDSAASLEGVGCELFPWSHNAEQDEEDAPVGNLPNSTLYKWALLEGEDKLIKDMMEKNDPEEDGCTDQGDGNAGSCPMSERVDEESESEGPAVEQIVVGVACGRLVAALATEKASLGFLFDITDVTSPTIVKSFHLSPASQYKSAALAYNDGELGEIDPENSIFLSADQSPSGKPAILFGGVHSGTVSFWQFDCVEPDKSSD